MKMNFFFINFFGIDCGVAVDISLEPVSDPQKKTSWCLLLLIVLFLIVLSLRLSCVSRIFFLNCFLSFSNSGIFVMRFFFLNCIHK